jgi:hypothetical protein
MRVLVVNAFGTSASGKKKAIEFKQFVQNTFDALKLHIHIAFKTPNQLGDYIYEEDSPHNDPKSIKLFDRLDFIFIGGHPTLTPWAPAVKQIFTLVRMCYLTNKCLFASSFACHMLANICCTGGKRIKVINGGKHGHGTPLKDIMNLKVSKHIQRHHVFFDCTSGDFYQFDPVTAHWSPLCHSGLRQRAKYATHLPRKYRAKEPYGKAVKQSVVATLLHETKLTVRGTEIQHWAFEGIKQREFLVPRQNIFDIDEKASGSARRKFFIIADSDDTLVPQIIESGHMFGVQFQISEKYPETIRILYNYVKHKFNQMNAYEYLDISSAFLLVGTHAHQLGDSRPPPPAGTVIPDDEAHQFHDPRVTLKKNARLYPSNSPRPPSSGSSRKQFSARRFQVNTPNTLQSVASSGILIDDPPGTPPPYVKPLKPIKSIGVLSYSSKSGSNKTGATGGTLRRSRSPVSQAIDPSALKPKAPIDRMEKIAMTLNARKFMSLTIKPEDFHVEDGDDNNLNPKTDDNFPFVNRANVSRQNNDQSYNSKSQHSRTSVRSGENSDDEKESKLSLPSRFFATKNSPRNNAKVVRINLKKKKPFCAWNKTYKQLNVGEAAFGKRDVGTVAASGPYISDYKAQRLEYLRGKTKWVSNQQFLRSFGKAKSLMKPLKGKIDHGEYKKPSGTFRDPDDRTRWMNPYKGWRNN